ncbi:hypothetical protein JHW43_005475 [Diplocarpon mali]|nr:hypothetical protein JHW43_005475 [Diplocarpon mali]
MKLSQLRQSRCDREVEGGGAESRGSSGARRICCSRSSNQDEKLKEEEYNRTEQVYGCLRDMVGGRRRIVVVIPGRKQHGFSTLHATATATTRREVEVTEARLPFSLQTLQTVGVDESELT